MSTDKDVENAVIKIVASSLKLEESKITPDSRFIEDLRADSLDTVELMMAIEAKFKCDIPDEDAGKILTVADVIRYIENKQPVVGS
ncbi:acyl carrier protein [Candidatus Tisiphia endosymbiont of Beris chalybata]|uniref:acyl carrier protein n=1 Tax=Candidatus Tisiphia endosymbiont of Beris chalybata TaxID=3066262 RepID=UPI00312C946B